MLYFKHLSTLQSDTSLLYLCRSREEGINFTHSLFEKVSSIQDFRDWNKKRKCVLTVAVTHPSAGKHSNP